MKESGKKKSSVFAISQQPASYPLSEKCVLPDWLLLVCLFFFILGGIQDIPVYFPEGHRPQISGKTRIHLKVLFGDKISV